MAATWLRILLNWRRYVIIFLTPILLAPLPLCIPGTESRCAYVVLIMAVYWITEVVHLGVTAFLPFILFPLLGVVGSKQITPPYFKDTNVLFVGSMIVAVAIEHWELHKRIALRILLLVGAQPRRLMLGFMLCTAFLSMWISNTATTAMMVPIVNAVLGELEQDKLKRNLEEREEENQNHLEDRLDQSGVPSFAGEAYELQSLTEETSRGSGRKVEISQETRDEQDNRSDEDKWKSKNHSSEQSEEPYLIRMRKCLMLSIAYSANVGGTATLTGTGPNIVFGGQINVLFPDSPGFGFAQWFGFAFPQAVFLLFVAWLWLQLLFMGWKFRCFRKGRKAKDPRQTQMVKNVLRQQYKDLGPMLFAEKAVLGHFVLLALLWFFREPKFVPGWAAAFKEKYVRDATAAIFISVSLFMFPSEMPKFGWDEKGKATKPPPALLTWRTVGQKLPWGIIFLLGSGFAMAEACKVSGLSEWLGLQLATLKAIPSYAIVIIICLVITMFTEVTSNVATATIFLPILATLAEKTAVHPWYLMIPATISCSFAYMLPVATPPNAIVFSEGTLRVRDMVKAGFGMNLICVVVLVITINTYGAAMFDLRTFPHWATQNVTLVCTNVTSS